MTSDGRILSRQRRETQMCTYTHKQTCERTVYDPTICRNTFIFSDCFVKQVYECNKYYLDCCEGDIMDQGKCYAPDDECKKCYTITDCDGVVTKLTSREGNIKSKNYPKDYAPNEDCTWTVRGSRNSTIRIRVVDFQLQRQVLDTRDCQWDWQTGTYVCRKMCADWVILQGGDNDVTPAVQECGVKRNFKDFQTMASIAQIRFHSNEEDSGSGFHLVFTIVGGADPEPGIARVNTTSKPPEATTAHETTMQTGIEPVVTTTPTSNGGTKICPGKLIWDPCPRCTRTCNNLKQSEEQCRIDFRSPSDPASETRCHPGCACPESFPIWHSLDCIIAEKCEIEEKTIETDVCQQKGRVKGKCLRTCDNIAMGEEECEKNTLTTERFTAPFVCVCPKGQYMLKDKCVSLRGCQSELNKRCLKGQVWTTCLPQCPLTCTSGVECTKVADPCVAGCICPEDKPILHEGSCITIAKCPADRDIMCGKQFYEPVLKILGGRTAVKGSWPWIVQIEKIVNGKFALSCGGTLICEKWILTASHCFLALGRPFLETETWKYRLHIGKHFKQHAPSDIITGMIANVQPHRIVPHPDYSPTTHVNDIALVELGAPVKLSKLVRPACIHNVSDYEPIPGSGKTCISMGWGAESNNENPAVRPNSNQVLKQVTLSPRKYSYCSKLFLNFDFLKMHCVGGHANQDTCSGDSGGPLMCLREDNRWYVDGVVSFGLKCGVQDEPGVYTRVPQYRHWIKTTTGSTCGSPSMIWNKST